MQGEGAAVGGSPNAGHGVGRAGQQFHGGTADHPPPTAGMGCACDLAPPCRPSCQPRYALGLLLAACDEHQTAAATGRSTEGVTGGVSTKRTCSPWRPEVVSPSCGASAARSQKSQGS